MIGARIMTAGAEIHSRLQPQICINFFGKFHALILDLKMDLEPSLIISGDNSYS